MSWNDAILIALLFGIKSMSTMVRQQGDQSISPRAATLKLIASVPEVKSESIATQLYQRWSRKAVRKYAAAQEKKWRNWAEALKK